MVKNLCVPYLVLWLSLQTIRQVLITRRDGCILLFDDCVLEHKLPDDSRYDNRLTGSQLPVRSVFKTPEKLPVLCAHVVGVAGENKRVLWCGTKYEMLLVFDVYPSRIDYCRKHYCRSRYHTVKENRIASLAAMGSEKKGLMWALSLPANVLYCWDREKEDLLRTVECSTLTHDLQGTWRDCKDCLGLSIITPSFSFSLPSSFPQSPHSVQWATSSSLPTLTAGFLF